MTQAARRSHALGRQALKLLVSAGLLYLLFRAIPLREILRVLAAVSPAMFAAGVALQFANRGLSTLPLKVITESQGIDLGRGALYRILLAVQFYSLLLPGALAGGGATWLKYIEHGAGKRAAAATVLINRAVALLVLLPVGAVGFTLDQRLATHPLALLLGLAATSLACALLLWYPWPHAMVAWRKRTGWVLRRGASDSAEEETRRQFAGAPTGAVCSAPEERPPRSFPPRATPRWRRHVAALTDRLTIFQEMPPRNKAMVVAGAVAAELGNVAAMWAFAGAVGAHVDFVSVMWMRGLLQTALLLPLSIAGLGVREVSLVGLGALVGVPAPAAVAWSLAILAGSVLVALAGGLLEATGRAAPLPSRAPAKT
jgi:uncharacterized membrane protein YbhN (UPF0104 family)